MDLTTLPICNTCSRPIDLDRMNREMEELALTIGLDDGANYGFSLVDLTPVEAQIRINRGECSCDESGAKKPTVSPNQGRLFDL